MYDDTKARAGRNIKRGPSRAAYLVLAIIFLGSMCFVIICGEFFGCRSVRHSPIVLIGIGVVFTFGIIALYNFLTLRDLKVYDKGILLPKKPLFGNEIFVPFDEIEKVVVVRNVKDIFPYYSRSPYDYLIYLVKPNKRLYINKTRKEIRDIRRGDPRVWDILTYMDVSDIDGFINAVKDKVDVEEIK